MKYYMSEPNPTAERMDAIEEIKRKYPEATQEEIEELLTELTDPYAR